VIEWNFSEVSGVNLKHSLECVGRSICPILNIVLRRKGFTGFVEHC
ncbi:3246_t:CDS:2, partial [Gigaspora margarita]